MNEATDPIDQDELAAFVAATLSAITAGVAEASNSTKHQDHEGYSTFEIPNNVEFDVAVTAKRSSERGKGIKVQVASIGGHLGGKSADESETVSRIRFTVPWRYTRTAPIRMPGSSGY